MVSKRATIEEFSSGVELDNLLMQPLLAAGSSQSSTAVESDVHNAQSRNRRRIMTYVMTKPCPICRQQLTKQTPTETVHCACGKHVWQG
ncbi:MAG: hypothetical protein JO159_17840 [Acidobacteria bacterium]|nr:hypothetical protein [Acidobacteriota bacterium]